MPDGPVLELKGITKRFPGVLANDNVDFDLLPGEVHALLGENGAGKSTLMSILYGLYHPDEGRILRHGEDVRISSPRDAIDRGIGMVHQHFMLIPVMTVAENIVLGVEPRHDGILLDHAAANKRVRRALGALRPRGRARCADRQDHRRPAATRRDPEGALPRRGDPDPRRADRGPHPAGGGELFEIIRSLISQEGKSIIFITHKLNEVLEIADRITVLRRGKKIETLPAAGATEESLARLMVGREVLLRVDKAPAQPGEPLLEVEDLHALDDRGLEAVRGVSLTCGRGDRGHRGRRRKRPDPAGRGAHRPPGSTGGSVQVAGRDHPCEHAHDSPLGRRAHPRRTGSAAASCSSSTSRRTWRCTTSTVRRTRGSDGSTRAG